MQCPTHKKKLTLIAEEDKTKRCEMCSRPSKLKCESCKFVLCSNCRICPAKHFLLKIVDLNKACTSYYSNSYNCDTCKQNNTVDDDGIWHCTECKFDVCPKCLD